MRHCQQAESSAIRCSYKEPKLSIRWQPKHVHTEVAVFVSRRSTGGQPIPGQHTNRYSQPSHSEECGAFRFLLWWLFLHRRLRFGNEAQLALSRIAPFGGSLPPGAIRFYSNGSRKSRNPLYLSLFAPKKASK